MCQHIELNAGDGIVPVSGMCVWCLSVCARARVFLAPDILVSRAIITISPTPTPTIVTNLCFRLSPDTYLNTLGRTH